MKKLLYYSLFALSVLAISSCGSKNVYEPKAFSVSETKQVYFSPGNLQYHCKNKEWRFAPLQYDCIGKDNVNISDDYNGYIDLFGWATSDNPTLASEESKDYINVPFTEWGTKINDGNVWQTLTYDEWQYIIEGRENASDKYAVAEVAEVQGLILLPDDWESPDGLSFRRGVYEDENGQIFYGKKNKYSATDWQKMESSGAVFLPAAGLRYGTHIQDVRSTGDYWTSSTGGYTFGFNSCYIYACHLSFSYGAYSVRLVRAL